MTISIVSPVDSVRQALILFAAKKFPKCPVVIHHMERLGEGDSGDTVTIAHYLLNDGVSRHRYITAADFRADYPFRHHDRIVLRGAWIVTVELNTVGRNGTSRTSVKEVSRTRFK